MSDEQKTAQVDEEMHTFLVQAPKWVSERLQEEAKRQGISRMALVKVWLVEKLDALKKERSRD